MTDTATTRLEAWEVFRRQESTLVALNLLALASVVVVHVSFWGVLGPPSLAGAVALGLRFIEQAAELAWLQRASRPLSPRAIRIWSRASIWANVGFAFLMGALGRGHDPHYAVLMVLPMVAAGFHLSGGGLAAVVAAGSGLTVLQVWLHGRTGRAGLAWAEFFEAATISLIFLVVSIIVRTLARDLEHDRSELRASLTVLQETRDRLITEEKHAAIGRLASAMAHEIRNPLAAISSAIEMVQETPDAGMQREAIGIASAEIRRLDRLTSEFVTYARTKPPTRSEVPLPDLVGYLASSVRLRAERAGVSVDTVAPALLTASLDAYQVQQAVEHLTLNAIEATPRGGRVVIGVEPRSRDLVAVWVENTAGPIRAEDAARLFEPFFTTRPSGTGLGLAISRRIARAHGGDLALVVNRDGLVRFELVIPAS